MQENPMRLNKYLANLGYASRREADRWIQAGWVKINGEIINNPATRILPDSSEVELDPQARNMQENRITIKVHKPAGVVVSAQPKEGSTIYELTADAPKGLFPIGRIDKDSSGLILMTNDSTLTKRIIGKENSVEKEYYVKTEQPIQDGALQKLRDGLPMMGTRTLPAKVKRVGAGAFHIIIREGKNRQIRRMCQKVGHKVKLLKRIRIGNILLGKLKPGEWASVTPEENDWLSTLNQSNRKLSL